jgi:predicted nucleotidyltransferase
VSLLATALSSISRDLDAAEARFALVGALAVSVRTEPRFTRDADIAVSVSGDAEAEALIFALQRKGYTVGATVEQEAVKRLATVRLLPPGEELIGMFVDLLFASSGIEREVVDEAERLEVLEGIALSVATTPHLIALKILSRDDEKRPQDIVDLRALLRVASVADLSEARRVLALVEERGYHRGRDLLAALDGFTRTEPA